MHLLYVAIIFVVAFAVLSAPIHYFLHKIIPVGFRSDVVDTFIVAGTLAGIVAYAAPHLPDKIESLFSKNKPPDVAQPATPSSLTISSTDRSSKLELSEIALRFLYGEDINVFTDEKTNSIYGIWDASPQLFTEFFGNKIQRTSIRSRVLFATSLKAFGKESYLVLTVSVPDSPSDPTLYTCHKCAPAIGGVLYSAVRNQWRVRAKTILIDNLGYSGEVLNWELRSIGTNNEGAFFEHKHILKGNHDTSLVLVGVSGNQLIELLKVQTAADDDGSCNINEGIAKTEHRPFRRQKECYKFVSRHEFKMGENEDYSDLILTFAGTLKNQDSGIISDVSRIETYTFTPAGYRLTHIDKIAPIDPEDLDTN